MSASTIALFRIVGGSTARQLWAAAPYQRSLYFNVQASGSHVEQSGVMRLTGIPLTVGAAYGQPEIMSIRFFVPEPRATFEAQYDAATRRGVLSCDTSQARLEWLGIDQNTVALLAQRELSTVADVLCHREFALCNWLLPETHMGEVFAQRAVGRFVQLRYRLQALNPALRFQDGPHDELTLLNSF